MILIFGRNNSWISRIIRLWTASDWSHVAIMDNDDMHVIEAKGPEGVVRTHIFEFLARYEHVEYKYLQGDIERARAHLGKPFDMQGIRGILKRSFTHCPDSWFCSELVAHAATHIPDESAHHITPEQLYRLSTNLPGSSTAHANSLQE